MIRGKSQIAIENRGRRKAAPFLLRDRAGSARNAPGQGFNSAIHDHIFGLGVNYRFDPGAILAGY